MRVAVIGTYHHRSGVHYWARAVAQLGHEVVRIGPWLVNEPFGSHGRFPDVLLPGRTGMIYQWAEIHALLRAPVDAAIIVEGGCGIRVLGIPVPWAYVTTEGTNYQWVPPEIPCFTHMVVPKFIPKDRTVEWLPTFFDVEEAKLALDGACPEPAYDLIQLGSRRQDRLTMWQALHDRTPDLNMVFGELWGPLYMHAHANALATWSATGAIWTPDDPCSASIKFLTTRVFDAMAVGCIVYLQRGGGVDVLFEDGVHYLGYDPVWGGHEWVPPMDWLIDTTRALRRDAARAQRIRQAAMDLAWSRHSGHHRARRVLERLCVGPSVSSV